MINEAIKKLAEKKAKLDVFRPLPLALVKNLDEWFRVELTYTSNAIEGNTLSRQETALVIEKGITVDGKSITEHLEAINHAEALDYIKKLAEGKRQDLKESDVLSLHQLILKKIDDTNAGKYRNVAVRIAGSQVVLPNSLKIPELMATFMIWLKGPLSEHPIDIAAKAHFDLVSIHPFVDGNGRTARLLMNLLLMQEGYPPALIRKEDRRIYVNAIEKGQLAGDMADFYQVIYEAIDRSLDIYLNAVEGKEPSVL